MDTVDFMGLGDSWRHGGPVEFYGDYWIQEGELPLWNPLINCGQPFAANPQCFVFYPPNLLRSALTFSPTPFKTHIGKILSAIFHISLGGCGAFLFARSHRFSPGASFVAGIAFALSAGMLNRALSYDFHFALAWLPFLFWMMRISIHASSPSQQFSYASIAGCFYGLAILAGTPIYMLLFGFLLAPYCFLHRIAFHDWTNTDRFRSLINGMVFIP